MKATTDMGPPKDHGIMPMGPLMLHPMAASAAATAIGIGFVGQMAGLMLGSMGAAMDASRRMNMPGAAGLCEPLAGEAAMPDGRAEVGRAPVAKPASRPSPRKAQTMAGSGDEKSAVQSRAPKGRPARPVEMAKPDAPDDLKKIAGIGPKLEQVLNGLGIWTFRQIMSWAPEEAAWLDDYLQFRGRIGRDGWQEQAARLASPAK